MSSRIAAIVGRPNVGKSAIFNRLVGRRIAIVHEESGVTRDRLVCEAEWGEERFEVVDTGGIGNMDRATVREAISAGVRRQVDVALEDAAVVIFVVDVQTGIAPLDEEVAAILRAGGGRVFIAANKADNQELDAGALEFEKFGFPVFPVSALHNRGFFPLMDQVVVHLPPATEQEGRPPLKIAVVGRPNVGKSSYINRLLRDERVIVSDTPGTTRDSVEVPFAIGSGPQARRYQLIDTAGIRRRRKVRNAVERFSLLRAEKSIERADVAVLVVDAREGITVQDRRIASKVLSCLKGCAILVNKWDMATITQRKFREEFEGVLASIRYVPVVFVSAKTGYDVRKTIDTVDHVASQVRAELPTGVLNRVILQAHEKVQPPLIAGKRLKIYYSAQTGYQPVRVTLFVNDPKRIRPAYRAYLEKVLRSAFGLEGAPIVLQLRSRRKKDSTRSRR